ncbi:aryl-alcohol dehydrogenase-like predicted oxidoreductase [Antricoccus suffuscus]|uniref:Aryl-alcohol dehydrogenase-like predicted oxidoreductase n=1 Tax=Antricoccus suffuscus TaxID=1629062 RepID=A0A2T1A0Q5_9ACTN|nr:aldo/keto reductase [Antricoccus suffuscus]PRZ42186.1 aryl-alcohol dehydrogenase-like predicted oxidoreductase [Antricoccus suffuscus]
MRYVKLGNTGLDVSEIALGCMTYGAPDRGTHPWSLPEEQSRPLLKQAVEAGINFFDTANVYSLGSSEEIVGRALKDFTNRDEVVIATKVFNKMHDGPNGFGLSRKAIFAQADASLRRLGTDFIDLYQIHRWDRRTPIEETMEALHDLVKSGKVRYLGASSMYTWQFAKAQHVAVVGGWTPFISMQNHYNLLAREEEREMLPYCQDQGIGVIPWSPLARGRLTRPWDATSNRLETDTFGKTLYKDEDSQIVSAVGKVAETRGVSMAQVALAWVRSRQAVTAPIIGASKQSQLAEAVAALEVELSEDEVQSLEAAYTPRENAGFR